EDMPEAGTPSAPVGSGAFTNRVTATGTYTQTPCTLATVNATTSSCSATIAPSIAGTVIPTNGETPNENNQRTSNGTSNTVSVGGTRPTTTAVTCSPSTVVVSQTITCTAFVKDTGTGAACAPGGTVAFTNGGTSGGSFTGTPCTLASVNTTTSSCNVTFVPTTAGTVIAQGTYTATDGVHSSGVQTSSNTVTVTLRTTATAVSCTPATVVVAQTVTCTGFVKDTSAAGTASAPSGTVGFTNGGTATGSFIGSPCTLASVNATTSSCNVTITPTSSGTIIASGTYTSSDTAHSGSGPTASNTVTVNRRTTSTAVTCAPTSIAIGQA